MLGKSFRFRLFETVYNLGGVRHVTREDVVAAFLFQGGLERDVTPAV